MCCSNVEELELGFNSLLRSLSNVEPNELKLSETFRGITSSICVGLFTLLCNGSACVCMC